MSTEAGQQRDFLPHRESKAHPRGCLNFGMFELALETGELRRSGRLVRLRPQAAAVLARLAERGGELVARDELRRAIWGAAEGYAIDQALNDCVREIRIALNDTAGSPRFVETLPKRGYRFLAPVRLTPAALVAARPGPQPVPVGAPSGLRLILALAIGALTLAQGASYLRGGSGPGSSQRVLLAVQDFADLSEAPADDPLAAGLAEELAARLGSLGAPNLGVIGRTSTERLGRGPDSIERAGRDLGAHYVLEGSVRRSADRVRVTARLVRVSDRITTWSQSQERLRRDILGLQNEIALNVARGIAVALAPPALERLRRAAAMDPAAHETLLRARNAWKRRTLQAVRQSVELFEDVLGRDATIAEAWAGLADAHAVLSEIDERGRSEHRGRAIAAARRAIAVDPGLAEAHASLGLVLRMHLWQWAEAEAELRQAVELNPSYVPARLWLSDLLRIDGRVEEALEHALAAREIEPLSPGVQVSIGKVALWREDFQEAGRRFAAALDLQADFVHAQVWWFRSLVAQGRFEEAIEHFGARGLSAETFGGELGQAYAAAGYRRQARAMLTRLQARPSGNAYGIALVLAGLEQHAEALAWIERAFQEGDPALRALAADPRLRRLRPDPRFAALVRRLGLPG